MGSNNGKFSENDQEKFAQKKDIQFKINGKRYNVRPGSIPLDTTLNSFIRIYAGLTGTKFMCREGGCGCCTVLMRRKHPLTGSDWIGTVNSCLMFVYSCHGVEVLTIEGVGNRQTGYHPAQTRLAQMNGTQCGYCSPGMVMTMVGLLENQQGRITMSDVEKHLGGNICRCTGYRPILDAFKSLANDADPSLTTKTCTDIEDLPKKCVFSCQMCPIIPSEPMHFPLENHREWFRVTRLNDVLKILDKSNNRPYMLVAGNTAHGVYRRPEDIEIFIDITEVEDLRVTMLGDTLEVGAGVTLTEFIGFLNEAAQAKPQEFSYCRQLSKHLELVAHPSVRNVGTIGGNLSLKHQHPEFPSDVFLILETVGAFITLIECTGLHRVVSIEDFMYKSMRKRVLIRVTLPPLHPDKYSLVTYKIMPRAQNAHAIINAGFLFKFNPDRSTVQQARICYGGVNPRFVHATNTENLLASKNLFANETLCLLMASLSEELKFDWILPDNSPRYRKMLAMGLLYKAILSLAPPERLRECVKSGGGEIHRGMSSGKQEINSPEHVLPKIEGVIQCSGEAQYHNDHSYMLHEVWGAFVPATSVKATILDIDASEALNIPGVVAFFSAKDIPGVNNYTTKVFIPPLNVLQVDELFCSGTVLYHSQPVGIILADTMKLALKAAKAVRITYSKPDDVKLLLSVDDVLEAGAVDRIFDYENLLEAESRGSDTATTITGKIQLTAQYHYYMEPQTTVCKPTESGGLTVYTSTHCLHFSQMGIAQVLKIPENSVFMKVNRVGGSFGGKNSKSVQVACAAALACWHLKRPVRFVLSMEDDMMMMGKRFSIQSQYEIEVDKSGVIQKLENIAYIDVAGSKNEVPVRSFITTLFTSVYDSATWSMDIKGVYTDTSPGTWFRAPGFFEGHAMAENIMEHIANHLQLDPLDVRLANMHKGQPIREILLEFLSKCNYESRREHVALYNAGNRWRKRGIAFVPMCYGIRTDTRYGVFVAVYAVDGSVSVCHGGVDMGQGINTKVAQIAARTLGLPVNMIKIETPNSLVSANVTLTGGSQTMDAVGKLVLAACNNILERMKPVREENPSSSWADLVRITYERDISLVSYVASDPDRDAIQYNVYGCACTEIEVDMLTGDFQLRRVDIVEDVGESLNPAIDIGQIEGAFVMGIGYWLHERIVRNPETGEILTNRSWTYKPPGARDIPVDFRVSFLQKQQLPAGLIGSKAVGEPAMCMSISAIFALRNAINSSREDAGLPHSFVRLDGSTQKEDILLLSGTHFSQFQL
ncbi:xanthine dehydrogenase [Sergentomyia squamirostris]